MLRRDAEPIVSSLCWMYRAMPPASSYSKYKACIAIVMLLFLVSQVIDQLVTVSLREGFAVRKSIIGQ